jgi:NAD(P)-dependent dehydrogenase (short-subunit alcohol dehydrogenase family)
MTQALQGKVAVITGGTTGIGLAIAKEFVAQGAAVVVTDLVREALDQTVNEIGPGSFGAKADASNISEMDILLKDVKAKHGRLDTVICNAVKDEHAPLGKITEAQFDKMVGINLKGVLFTIQSAHAAWRSKPSYYAVSTEDRTINPDLERFMAKRMGAKTIEVNASHLFPPRGNHAVDPRSRRTASLMTQGLGAVMKA